MSAFDDDDSWLGVDNLLAEAGQSVWVAKRVPPPEDDGEEPAKINSRTWLRGVQSLQVQMRCYRPLQGHADQNLERAWHSVAVVGRP